MDLSIIDTTTGEKVQVTKAKKKQMADYIESLHSKEISNLLSEVNFYRRGVSALEGVIKDHIKGSDLEFDDGGVAFFEDHKVKQVNSYRFSEKLLEEDGTDEEKEAYKKIKEKYTKPSTYLKI